jgi:acyl carrier protein
VNEKLILDKLIKLLNEVLEIRLSRDDIKGIERLKDLGINSISFIKLTVNIELEFGFEFCDEDLDYNKFDTIQSILLYINKKVST